MDLSTVLSCGTTIPFAAGRRTASQGRSADDLVGGFLGFASVTVSLRAMVQEGNLCLIDRFQT